MANLWIAPTNDTQRAAQVANASEIGNGFEWTPDGNLIFDSSSGDNFGIWVMHSDGTNLKRVSGNLGAYFFPQVTPDNRSIVFELAREGGRSVWKMEIDGSNAKQLTDAQVRRRMCLSSDGRWVLFETIEDNAPRILKVSIDGGTAVPLAPRGPFRPIVSPQDGLIAYLSMENEMNAKVQVHFISPDGVLPHKTIELSQSVVEAVSMSFTPDGKELAYIDSRNGSSNIWTIRIDGKGEAKPLTDFKTDGISNFAWSPDGKRLAIVRGTTISDAVFINESK